MVSFLLPYFVEISELNTNIVDLIRRRVLWQLIGICTVCQCPFYGTLSINGLMCIQNFIRIPHMAEDLR